MRLTLGSIKELGCMHKHITWVSFERFKLPKNGLSFPVSCVAYDFALNNNLTSSRTSGETKLVNDLRIFL